MKIAITGGAGFIGTALAELLRADGHQLVILDTVYSEKFSEQTEIVDVTDVEAVSRALAGVDVIYHMAAVHRDDVKPLQRYYTVNVGGAENVARAAKENNIKTIINTSSVAVYGLNSGDSRENDEPAPFNDYGRSKYEAEKVLNKWAAEDPDHKLVNVRLVATFGAGNRGNIYTLLDQIARNRFVMIGSGDNRKSIAYVGNVAAFLKHVLDLRAGVHLFNYADKPDLSMNELVSVARQKMGMEGIGPRLPYAVGLVGGMTLDLAAQATGKTFPISAIRVKKFCANTIVNADRLRETGFTRPFTLESGLADMIAVEFPPAKKAA